MKRTLMLLLLLGIALNTGTVSSQRRPDDFKPFWENFKTAVINGDKNTVASLTKFPLGMSYGIRSIRSRAEFMRRYREVFNQQTDAAKCFAEKEPAKGEAKTPTWIIYCPDEGGSEVVAFIFERGKPGWRFTALDNINE